MALTVALALLAIGGVFHVFLEKSLRDSINTGLEGVANAAADSIHRFVASSLRDAQAVAAYLPLEAVDQQDSLVAEVLLGKMCEIFPQFDNAYSSWMPAASYGRTIPHGGGAGKILRLPPVFPADQENPKGNCGGAL